MKAIVRDTYGAPDVLHVRDVDPPRLTDGQVLVRVHAAGVARSVWHLVTGLPYPLRLAYGLRAPNNPVPGSEFAGQVDAVGPGVTTLHPGDDVYGWADGAFAEYARARADRLAPMPAMLTYEQAAALPESATTARQALHDHGRLQHGERVLIIGASGGVGSYAIQLAVAAGARVTGVCRTRKVDTVRTLGADQVIDYTREDITAHGQRYDVVLDIGGNRPVRTLRRLLAPRGRLVIVGGEGGGRWTGGLGRQLRATLLSPVLRQKLGSFVAAERGSDLEDLRELVDAGTVTPVLDRTFPLTEAADALRYLEHGHACGKIVLTV